MNRDEVFTIKARRCKRCGGLLTSAQALKDGYGHSCKLKVQAEKRRRLAMKNQLTLFPIEEKEIGESD